MLDNASADHHEAELRRAIEENARRETWCVRALVLLLIFEAVVFWRYAGDKPWYETLAFILCDVGVALAVGGEVKFEARRSVAQSELDRISDEKVAASIARAAEADARAAEANQKADEARLELAKYRQSRVLSPEQIDRVVEALKPFPDVEYDAATSSTDPEIMQLLGFLEMALSKARWRGIDCRVSTGVVTGLTRPGAPTILTNLPATDVMVGISRPQAEMPEVARAALGLASALIAEQIEANTVVFQQPVPDTNQNAVHIRIGRKT